MPDAALVFAPTPNEEHANILQAKTHGARSAWELGTRLLRFRETGEWQQVTLGGPYDDWTDYLDRGVKVGRTTAYRYMDAAAFPLTLSLLHGTEKMSWLRKVVELTAVDESADEALALELPLKAGGTKPFAAMTAEEAEAAYLLGGSVLLDVRGVPCEVAADVFAALASAVRGVPGRHAGATRG